MNPEFTRRTAYPDGDLFEAMADNALIELDGMWYWQRTAGSEIGAIVSPVFATQERAVRFADECQLYTPFERFRYGDSLTPVVDWGAARAERHAGMPLPELDKLWKLSPESALRALTRVFARALRGTGWQCDIEHGDDRTSPTSRGGGPAGVSFRFRRDDLPHAP